MDCETSRFGDSRVNAVRGHERSGDSADPLIDVAEVDARCAPLLPSSE